MRVFKTKLFSRFARRADIGDEALREAIERAERGLVDADLGEGIIKQRVARPGEGKSGGFRTIIGYNARNRAVFLYGFAKNAQDNISPKDLAALRKLGATYLALGDDDLKVALAEDELIEVPYGEERVPQ